MIYAIVIYLLIALIILWLVMDLKDKFNEERDLELNWQTIIFMALAWPILFVLLLFSILDDLILRIKIK